MKLALFVLSLTAVAVGAQEVGKKEPVDPFSHVSYHVRKHDGSGLKAMHKNQIGVDETLEIHWDEDPFVSALVTAYGVGSGDGTLVERIGLLEDVVTSCVEARARLSAVGTRAYYVGRSTSSPEETGRVLSADPEYQALNNQFSVAARSMGKAFKAYESWLNDRGQEIEAARVKDALNKTAGKDYSAMAAVVQEELAAVQSMLAQRTRDAMRMNVSVRATLHTRGGDARRLHVNGYDKIKEGEPESSPRFRLGVDEQVQAEFQAAEKLGKVIEELRDGTLKEEVRAAKEELVKLAKELGDTLAKDILKAELETLLRDLEESANDAIAPAIRDVRVVLDLIDVFKQAVRGVDGIEDIGPLLALAKEIEESFQAVIDTVRDLPARLEQLLKALGDSAVTSAVTVRAEATSAIKATIEKLKPESGDAPAIAAVLATFKELKEALGFSRSVTEKAQDVVETPRAIDGGGLDTAIHMLTAGDRRHSDLLVVEIEVSEVNEDTGSEVIVKHYRRIRLRMSGVRVETRGALFLVDPRDSVTGGQNWEPVPSISYVMHWNWGDSQFMNDVLDPGLGLSLSLMDFSDSEDLEVGAGISLTFFKDLLWFGYGRDIQAEIDYAYVGVNPLLIGDLWSQGGVSPSPK